jgi:glucosylceramidase
MRRLFGPGGIGLRVLRVPIGASDFTRNGRPYSYDDLPQGTSDPGLQRFSIAHDAPYILPTLRQALALRPGLSILASPWSPPAWMKANDSLSDVRRRGVLLPRDYGALARYLVRFVEAYTAQHVPIDSITPANEPGQVTRYPGVNLSEAGEAAVIARYLAPALRAAGLRTRIFGLDFAWRHAPFADALARDPRVRAVLAGIAWHCYRGDPRAMDVIHRLLPGAAQMVTECSGGIAPGPTAELVITALRHWGSAVIMWNLALDPAGGPVQPPNHGCHGCTGVVTISERTHTIRYGIDYYELGQFGRFVRPGARRVASNTFVTVHPARSKPRIDYVTPGLDDVAIRNPDGSDVLLVQNTAAHAIRFAVVWRHKALTYTVPAGATATLAWR